MLMHPKSTKDQILGFFKKSGRLSITDIANELQITDMAVRRHIHSLELEGLVESITQKQTKGRPSKVYQLSPKGEELFPKRYKQLSIELLKELKEIGQESVITNIFTRKKNGLVEQYKTETLGKSIMEKLEALKEIQASEGFMPEISVKNGVIHFKEFNCPYVEAAKEFRQICASEKVLIKELLETDAVKVESCMAAGDHCCHYVIDQK
ncbi:HTH domain-containing protein [Bacillus sp. FJAT-29790]|uniref:helix-turn-helix transcriptional regulator n=1 Tax=Bacillus sp. FJAT-29790 TaxID=1895002 RepID=UPI001C24C9C5|nr:HTH domain-containing protein [Bacillus sp. FJAT-29790]MBU8880801.1 HTH domain-containing protein [Bacillus sp. FJAT-29790]